MIWKLLKALAKELKDWADKREYDETMDIISDEIK